MPWTFFGVELASRALQAMQTAMNTTGHNLANVNTPGYSRQRVNLATTEPQVIEGVRALFMG
ncbi:MAG: flagellar basal body protein, partial [Armatimonadota bacterium]